VTREWLQAAILFAAALMGVMLLKRFLGRVKTRAHWSFLPELAPSILNLGYVIALSIFLHSAPLGAKASAWAEDVTYILNVWVFLILVRKTFLVALVWSTRKAGSSQTLTHGFLPLLRNMATLFVFVMGGIMVLKHFNYDVMSLLTALGVGSLAVGLAAKEALSNMISGFVLIMDGNLRHGDRINLGSTTGDIERIGLRSTRIRTLDGNTMIVPNFDLVNTRVVNLSDPSRMSTCSTNIRVPFAADFDVVKTLGLKILKQIPEVDSTKDGWVTLNSLADGSQQIGIGCWVRDMDECGSVITQLNHRIVKELRAQNIFLVETPPLANPPH
jgi:MscS family membrane protein